MAIYLAFTIRHQNYLLHCFFVIHHSLSLFIYSLLFIHYHLLFIIAREACFVKSPCLEKSEIVPADHELLRAKMVDLGPPIFEPKMLQKIDF